MPETMPVSLPCGHREPKCTPGEPFRFQSGDCYVCWSYLHSPEYNLAFGGNGEVRPYRRPNLTGQSLPFDRSRDTCVHLGAPTGERKLCPSCQGSVEIKLRSCGRHGQCSTHKQLQDGTPCCLACGDYTPVPPTEYLTVDSGRLIPGHNFNCTMIDYQGRRLFAHRQAWSQARIRFAELGSDWQPVRSWGSDWRADLREWGQEDPRFFVFRDRLHLTYTSYDTRITTPAIVRFSADLSPESASLLTLRNRNSWEKNWMPFEWGGELYAIYSVQPHVILQFREANVERVYETGNPMPWSWGELRGGCPPVRVGDEYYHWAHARIPQDHGLYSVALYTFEAKPPFRVTRYCPWPLLRALQSERPHAGMPAVIYPGGAILDRDTWRVACGWMDASCRIYSFDAGQIERSLKSL